MTGDVTDMILNLDLTVDHDDKHRVAIYIDWQARRTARANRTHSASWATSSRGQEGRRDDRVSNIQYELLTTE